jgi:hypothetical protein
MQEYSNLNLKMIVDVPQILWHDNSARVMSLDFFPNSNYLVTGSVQSDEDTGIRVSVRRKRLTCGIPPSICISGAVRLTFDFIVLGAQVGDL